jgi:phospholipid/cholesterol/gamma-HCH transport system ATP-binding protein
MTPPAVNSAPSPPPADRAAAPPIIRVENLRAGYDGNILLDNVSFDVRAGEIFIILGGSGCGKSTLLKHMIGLHDPMAGRVLIDGQDVAAATGRDRREILRKIGVAYQSGALFGSMTVLENVRLPLEEFTRLPPKAMDLVAGMKLKLVGMLDAAGRAPAELSGGMVKRAAIARAMALDPRLVFLDEPSAGLDPITSAELDQLILFLARSLGITFVIVSHELASIDAIADRVIMLDKQARGIVAEGRPDDLRRNSPNPAVRRFFNRGAEA